MHLVADVGGTNTRLALSGPDGLRRLRRFRNDDFSSFGALLDSYAPGTLSGACVAVAGPVTSGSARLTNRDWTFHADAIAGHLPGLSGPVHLVNDLVALGHGLPALSPDQMSEIASGGQAGNDQRLIVGIGTGFNICLLKGETVIEAELGHASLPVRIIDMLSDGLGKEADSVARSFASNEALFSGRGLSDLHAALTGERLASPDLLTAYAEGSDRKTGHTAEFFARLLGRFSRELVFQYLPLGGIHFAGGAARGLLQSPAAGFMGRSFACPDAFSNTFGQVPLRLITDDAAALTGAARILVR